MPSALGHDVTMQARSPTLIALPLEVQCMICSYVGLTLNGDVFSLTHVLTVFEACSTARLDLSSSNKLGVQQDLQSVAVQSH